MDRAPHPWPQGDTEMAGRIRSLDWASTPLGPPVDWPPNLRLVVDLVLVSDFPMAILWGPDLRLLYNDAYRGLLGCKHPQGLGEPTQDIWSEVWDRNAPMFARVLGGETVSGSDAPYQIMRSETLEAALPERTS